MNFLSDLEAYHELWQPTAQHSNRLLQKYWLLGQFGTWNMMEPSQMVLCSSFCAKGNSFADYTCQESIRIAKELGMDTSSCTEKLWYAVYPGQLA